MAGRYNELKKKWVVDKTGGNILGRISDLEIEYSRNRVVSIVAGKKKRWWQPFSVLSETVIPWQQIDLIGSDTVLVTLPEGKLSEAEREKEK